MKNIFEAAIDDIFNVTEFRDVFTAGETEITCIQYAINTDTQYTEYGVDNGASFYITCKCSDYTPARGEKITFHDKQYKIANFTQDGFNLTYNIFLKDLTSK